MKNVFIFGSCVSRDTIEASRSSFNIVDYYARSSFYSLGKTAATYNFDFIEKMQSEFQKRMVKRDILKSLFANEPPNDIDLILIDFIDERCSLIQAEDGSVATLSKELASIIENNLNHQKICNSDAAYYDGFEKGFSKFLTFFDAHKSKIRIIKAYWAKHDDQGQPLNRPSSRAIDLQNKKLNSLYDISSKYIDQSQFINIPKDSLIVASEHKWGPAPFHYVSDFYDKVLLNIFNQQTCAPRDIN